MKIDFNQTLVDYRGKALHVEGDTPLTLKKCTCEALMAVYQSDKDVSGEDKLRRYLVACKVYQSEGILDLDVPEIKLIKDLIGKAYGALVVGPAWNALEGR